MQAVNVPMLCARIQHQRVHAMTKTRPGVYIKNLWCAHASRPSNTDRHSSAGKSSELGCFNAHHTVTQVTKSARTSGNTRNEWLSTGGEIAASRTSHTACLSPVCVPRAMASNSIPTVVNATRDKLTME